jgi:hypothetical protein
MTRLDKKELHAVHDDDVVEYLRHLGLLQKITDGKFKCSRCGGLIDLDNFGGLYSENKEIKIVCEKLECMTRLLGRKLQEKNHG